MRVPAMIVKFPVKAIFMALLAAAPAWAEAPPNAPPQASPAQVIFPGQAHPEVSEKIIQAYDHALERDYRAAREFCREIEREFPQNPAGPTGEMVLYQVMMLENDDYSYHQEFMDAARRAEAAAKSFARQAPENDWHYTLLGATRGIHGIYHLRRGEYLSAFYPGLKGLSHMMTAARMDPENWEAKMGIGLYLYYRSAYSRLMPIPWLDKREQGIAMIEQAGINRSYLEEVSRIALYYVYVNEEDYDTAVAYMDGLIEERPYFPVFYQLAGRALIEEGDHAGACQYYDRMREADPALYLPYLKLCQCALAMGNKQEARQWLQEFFSVLGDRETVHLKQAQDYKHKLGME